MSKLESELRALAESWRNRADAHRDEYGNTKGDVPYAVAVQGQVDIAKKRAQELDLKLDELKAKGML